mmetsp:Transcript_24939/g.56373  ORF Transcript_24939/g.56373 Transcript_24939/m.56373 type:complete len:962 (-) Transcript_24939:427-3312(-)
MSRSKASEYPESDDGMSTEYTQSNRRGWIKTAGICVGVGAVGAAIGAVVGIGAGGGFNKTNSASGVVQSSKAEVVTPDTPVTPSGNGAEDSTEDSTEDVKATGYGDYYDSPYYLYYGCADYYEATTDHSYPQYPERKLNSIRGLYGLSFDPGFRGPSCPEEDCVHVTNVEDLVDATCAAINNDSSVVNVCASIRPIAWFDGGVTLAYSKQAAGSVDVLTKCGIEHAYHSSVPSLKYQCIGDYQSGVSHPPPPIRGRVLHPHLDRKGDDVPFEPIDFINDIASGLACAIDFNEKLVTDTPQGFGSKNAAAGGDGPEFIAESIVENPEYPPGPDYVENPLNPDNIAFMVGNGFELEMEGFTFYNRFETGPMFYNHIGHLTLTNNIFINNWSRLPCHPNCFPDIRGGISPLDLFQADPLIVLDYDARDGFQGKWDPITDLVLHDLEDGFCLDIERTSSYFSKTTVVDSYFAHNNGMLMWFRGDAIVESNFFYSNILAPWKLLGYNPFETIFNFITGDFEPLNSEGIAMADILESMTGDLGDGLPAGFEQLADVGQVLSGGEADIAAAGYGLGGSPPESHVPINNPWRDLGFIVFDEFTCANAFQDTVLDYWYNNRRKLQGLSQYESLFETINHFTFGGNQLVAFNADTKEGAPVSFQLVSIRADWTNLFIGIDGLALPLPLTPLWLDDHSNAITLEENRYENFNAALGNDVAGTNFDWQLWALSVCSLTIVGGGCDFGDFDFLSGLRDLSFSAEKADLGRKLLSRLQDTTKDANRRLAEDPSGGAMPEAIGGAPGEAYDYLLLGGGLSLLGGTMFTDCNDGAAIVLRDFEFFEVVVNLICYETADIRDELPFCNVEKPFNTTLPIVEIRNNVYNGEVGGRRHLSRHLEKKAKKVAQNFHKALQQKDEHGRRLTSIEVIVGIILLVIGLVSTAPGGMLDYGPGKCLPFQGQVPDVVTPAYINGDI